MKTFEEIHSELIQLAINANVGNEYLAKLKQATKIEEIVLNGINNVGLCNTGDGNTGDRNAGNWNAGDRNAGNWNAGDRNTGGGNTGSGNTGNWNTGNRNTGNRNTGVNNAGDRNTGNRNTGVNNTGDRNTGYWNTGNWNTGHRNTGDRNTGYWNAGDGNAGLFNTTTPNLLMFNMPSEWTYKDWTKSKAFTASKKFILNKWISEYEMTDQEKIEQPLFHTKEGYLKEYNYKEACEIWWSKLTQKERNSFKELPNFSNEIFTQITGLKST